MSRAALLRHRAYYRIKQRKTPVLFTGVEIMNCIDLKLYVYVIDFFHVLTIGNDDDEYH